MTDDELIKHLRTASVQCDEMRLRDFGFLFKTAASEIVRLEMFNTFWEESANNAKKLLEDKLPKWIPVTERLPENQSPVLVFATMFENLDGDVVSPYVGMAYYTYSPKGGWWGGTDGNVYGAIGLVNVTHWMPLPNPPKEVKE